jgi:hypothetical protein
LAQSGKARLSADPLTQPHFRGAAPSDAMAGDNSRPDGMDASGLVRARPSCYIRAVARRFRHASTPHAVVAELVDALA